MKNHFNISDSIACILRKDLVVRGIFSDSLDSKLIPSREDHVQIPFVLIRLLLQHTQV